MMLPSRGPWTMWPKMDASFYWMKFSWIWRLGRSVWTYFKLIRYCSSVIFDRMLPWTRFCCIWLVIFLSTASSQWVADPEVVDGDPCSGHHLCDRRGLLQRLRQDQEAFQYGTWRNQSIDIIISNERLGQLIDLENSIHFVQIDSGHPVCVTGYVVCDVFRRWPARLIAGWWWSISRQWCRNGSPSRTQMRGGRERTGWLKRLSSSSSSSGNSLLWVVLFQLDTGRFFPPKEICIRNHWHLDTFF